MCNGSNVCVIDPMVVLWIQWLCNGSNVCVMDPMVVEWIQCIYIFFILHFIIFPDPFTLFLSLDDKHIPGSILFVHYKGLNVIKYCGLDESRSLNSDYRFLFETGILRNRNAIPSIKVRMVQYGMTWRKCSNDFLLLRTIKPFSVSREIFHLLSQESKSIFL